MPDVGMIDRLRRGRDAIGAAVRAEKPRPTGTGGTGTPRAASATKAPGSNAARPPDGAAPAHTGRATETLIDKESWLKVWLRVEGHQAAAEDFDAVAISAVRDLVARTVTENAAGPTITITRIEPTTDAPDDDAMQHA